MLKLLWVPIALFLALVIAVVYRLSAPPLEITIAAGGKGGGYHLIAERYASALQKRGVRARILDTKGAVENLELIAEPGKVQAALVQGGLLQGKYIPSVASVGRHFYEPLLIFTSAKVGEINRLKQLKGRRIAVGAMGTGTEVLVRSLLAANGFSPGDSLLVTMATDAAAAALQRGELDAAMFVMALEAPLIQGLLRDASVRLVSLARADAYARQFTYLTHLTLPAGAIDLMGDVPGSRVELVAPTAALLVRKDLHPALIYLLTEVASETHRELGVLGPLPQDKRQADPEYPLADAAERFYKHGAPFLHRHFPFWLADLLEQILLIGIPVLAVAFPTAGLVAQLYQWHWQRKLSRWSARLLNLQAGIDTPGRTKGAKSLDRELADLVAEMRSTQMPASYKDRVLQLIEQAYSMNSRLAHPMHAGAHAS